MPAVSLLDNPGDRAYILSAIETIERAIVECVHQAHELDQALLNLLRTLPEAERKEMPMAPGQGPKKK